MSQSGVSGVESARHATSQEKDIMTATVGLGASSSIKALR